MCGILAATDGSENGDRAVDLAADLARQAGCELLLVNVAHPLPRTRHRAENLAPELKALMDAEGIPLVEIYGSISNEIVAKAARRAEARHAPQVRTLVRIGDTAETILGIAADRHMDFIVVGKRGRGRLAGLLHGSVSQKLASNAHCSVVVVP
jgi:nucleotide-binding universal stress UspA family protein